MSKDIMWQELNGNNLPKQGSWILITDGKEWHKVYVTQQYEFAVSPDSDKAYRGNITHWCEVSLPKT